MVQHLFLSAELSNVTDLRPQDSVSQPFEYSFIIRCINCREVHSKPITVNLYERYETGDSKGDASFVSSCSFCKCRSQLSIKLPSKFKGYSQDDSGQRVKMLEIDARGYDVVEYVADGPFVCKGSESGCEFKEVLLEDTEWYDYDDEAAQETSITDVKWEIAKK